MFIVADMWRATGFNGALDLGGEMSALIVCDGHISWEAVLEKLPAIVPASARLSLGKMSRLFKAEALSDFVVVLIRWASLHPYYEHEVVSFAGSLSEAMLPVIEESFLQVETPLLQPELPAGARSCFTYRCGKAQSRQDPVLSQAGQALVESADLRGRRQWVYEKTNLLYVAESLPPLRQAFNNSHALSLVVDEVANVNDSSILGAFVSAPITADVSTGWFCPPQEMPALDIDLRTKSLSSRIEDALPAAFFRPTGVKKKPEGDYLIPTWHVCVAINNSLRNLLPDGLKCFEPAVRPSPLRRGHNGAYARTSSGSWIARENDEDWTLVAPVGLHGAK